ncbi:Gfo/Idh/MocA family oxidoreductase [Fontisphaera persica]|uniref:Gfo/Idh/MocA family oxidoreductase n=1 Tax=Fontisphaera persica TaxID=2974023 RepID=UPI0024C0746C|nr:Gfo/Idh/MocA family oxidoreductase [Fontisphaera persica]WCJ59861.1 Gfo/Idh/MocA family oxidoreductase [Fontisphaera persica]
MKRIPLRTSRRHFIKGAVAGLTTITIIPRHVLGQPGVPPPSETVGGALIGCGGRGPGTFDNLKGLNAVKLVECDVRFKDRADNKRYYTDFRRVLERKDIDVVAIATPPHWHALISIMAMEAGKDVMCEKPMTRFIAEGRAVVNAAKRYGRIFQIGTFGRFSAARNPGDVLTRKIMKSGLLKECKAVYIKAGGLKVKEWSGIVNAKPQPVPKWLDWDMYVGPSPMKPYHPHRFGGTHRGYWDYEGGGLGDMGQHAMDPVTWTYGVDDTAPVEIEALAPPAHPEVCGMWGWVELKYANGFTIVLVSGEWGPDYDRLKARPVRLEDLDEESRQKLKQMPDPEPLIDFTEAVKTRKQPGGHAEAAHRTVCIMHLANIAIRVGRKIRFDPVKEEIIGDEEANRLVNPPMRPPWHL